MEIRLLGPVELTVDGRVFNAGGPRQRLVLAALAAEAGRSVGIESLIDRVWDEPPELPRRALHVYVSRIRRLLETANGSGPVGVSRGSGGYLLDVDPDRVDVHRFRRLVSRAGREDNAEAERAALLGQALDLWRGPPLADLPGQWTSRVRAAWQQQYLDAVVAWAHAGMNTADLSVVLPRLTELAGEHPLVEPLAAVYMRALYAAGHASQALDHYTTLRHHLAEHLGADPGPKLQQLHRRILSADPTLTLSAAPTGPSRHMPRQLPAPPQMFTGRAAELADLETIHDASTVVVTAIDGMAGVGKTALAVQAAHQMVDRYPDGQLFIDLRGYTQGVAAIEPGEALDRMLRSLGVPGERIPADMDERAGLYRSRLADQRMMIVLDNAATETQVTPLLPGAPGCLVLVTSRRRLAGLDHTHTLSLDTLPPADAVTLLRHTAGDSRLAGQPPDLVAELVELCGRLPLAIRIAAARLRSHPTWKLEHLVRRLRDQQHRLAELAAGQRSVAAALDLSYQDLSADLQRTYRLLDLHPGADIDPHAAAALLDSTLPEAGQLLEQLLEAHLLQEPVPGRYRFHDLTRAHAATLATAEGAAESRRVMDRLFDYYLATAATAMDQLHPVETHRRPRIPPIATPSPEVSDPDTAQAWLDAEHPTLVAVAAHTAAHGWSSHTVRLSTTLFRYLNAGGHNLAALAIHSHARDAARCGGDQIAEAHALNNLGTVYRRFGRYDQAADCLRLALNISQEVGDRACQARILHNLGGLNERQGSYPEALDQYEQALALFREVGHRDGECRTLINLATVCLWEGNNAQAVSYCRQALVTSRETRDVAGEAIALDHLGLIYRRECRYVDAAEHHQRALAICRKIGHRVGEINTLNHLGTVLLQQGHYEVAADHHQRALTLCRETADRDGEAEALNGLGEVACAAGRATDAITQHNEALTAVDAGARNQRVRAHLGLSRAYHILGDHTSARRHSQHALAPPPDGPA